MCTQLTPRQWSPVERALEDGRGARAKRVVQSELAAVVREDLMDVRRGQLQHPADVRGGDEVPGRPHDVCAQDPPGIEGAVECRLRCRFWQPKTERPLRGAELLRLHRAKPRHDIGRPLVGCSRDALVVKSQVGNRKRGLTRVKGVLGAGFGRWIWELGIE